MLRDIKWSPDEKKIAREAFNKAHEREMESIKFSLYEKVAAIKKDKDIWELHNYLSKRRKQVDSKYDYRYSVLLNVFATLIMEGFLFEDDLEGLSDEKMAIIDKFCSR